jgi:hypothetical protein
MGLFSEQKPYSAVTNWVEQLCSEQYEEDDYTGVPDLCDVARLQDTGSVYPPSILSRANSIDQLKLREQ